MFVTGNRLTDKERELVTLIAGDEWLTRNEMAMKKGKLRLNPHEVTLLEGLSDSGIVEKRETTRGIASGYEYRATDAGKRALGES